MPTGLGQLLTPLGTTTGGDVHQSTPTSTPPTTVDGNVRWGCPADQTDRQTEPPVNAGAMDALLNFAQYPPSPETSLLLSRFDAIQESLARRDNAQAPADVPSSSIERPLSLETSALIHEGMLTYMDAALAPRANPGALASMPSSSVQQQHLPESRAASQGAGRGRGAGFLFHSARARRQKVGIQTLRALDAALTQDPNLNVTEWARMHHFHVRTIRYYIYRGALTPEARNRIDLADGKAPRLRKVGEDDLRALRNALAENSDLDVAGWARAHRLHIQTLKNSVQNGALTPEAQNRLDLADGKAPRLRKVGEDDLRALRDALADNAALDVVEWSRANHLHSRTIESYVLRGALTPEAQNRLDVIDGKAPSFRTVGRDDLRALRDALAQNPRLDAREWARANRLHPRTVIGCIFEGALTPEAQSRLDRAYGEASSLRRAEVEDLWELRDALAHNPGLELTKWARARNLNSRTVRSHVKKGALTPEAQNRLQRAGTQPAERWRSVAEVATSSPRE
ncbi:hypothetical protein [Pandoraea pulmonicola]|nr:hypothetical protein [Pandoraea pulmonicola]